MKAVVTFVTWAVEVIERPRLKIVVRENVYVVMLDDDIVAAYPPSALRGIVIQPD